MVLLHSIANSVVAEKVRVDCKVLASNSSSVQWKDPASPSSCLSGSKLRTPSGVCHVSTSPLTVHCTATLSPGHAGWLDVTATGMVATEDREKTPITAQLSYIPRPHRELIQTNN